jgi:hypothetical protein
MRRFYKFGTFFTMSPIRVCLPWILTAMVLVLLPCGLQSPQGHETQAAAALSWIAPAAATTLMGEPAPQPNLIQRIGAWISRLSVDPEAVKLYATWIIGAPALVIAAILILLMRPLGRKVPEAIQPPPASSASPPPMVNRPRRPANPASDDAMEGLSDKQRILRFFFQLFKNQIGAGPNLPSELFLVETRPTCPDETYEMRILQENEWTTRRMSIGLLGQGGGSRSKCFYVIYDSHMVVKIPSAPITAFTAYNRQIGVENAIVARLAPRECIVPRVSVILQTVYSFPDGDQISAELLEKKYKHALEVNPFLQEYLKIGPSFAFFMDLAKHFFLSTTLDELHRGKINLVEEALLHPELLWDHDGFVCRYGEEADGVCSAIQEVFGRAEKDLQALVAASKIVDDVPLFQLKRWFLIHMAGERIDAQREELPAILIENINQCLAGVVKRFRPKVQNYRNALAGYIQETRFSRQRTMLESLATNTLDLLAWIRARGMALRDLKPENLFVAGNPDEYPYFLNDPQKFSIGLIDVETAVPIHATDQNKIPQPQLAGTPLYATPSHLFSNAVLAEIYGDVRTVLHLQDWFAAIAIVFKIFTGKHLFVQTARVFPEIINRLKMLDPTGPELEADVTAISRLFWNSATAEFQEALCRHEGILSRVEVQVPADFVSEIVTTLDQDSRRIQHTIHQSVSEQSFFASDQKRRYLVEASADKIGQMKTRLTQELTAFGDKEAHREAALVFFRQLERLKHCHQRKLEAAAALKASAAPIAADQLLESMFQRVASFMYLPSWPNLKPSKWRGLTNLPTDITTYQATI